MTVRLIKSTTIDTIFKYFVSVHLYLLLVFQFTETEAQVFKKFPYRSIRNDTSDYIYAVSTSSDQKLWATGVFGNSAGPQISGFSELSENGFKPPAIVPDRPAEPTTYTGLYGLCYLESDSSYWPIFDALGYIKGLYYFKKNKWHYTFKDSIQGWIETPNAIRFRDIVDVFPDSDPQRLIMRSIYGNFYAYYPAQRKMEWLYKSQGSFGSIAKPYFRKSDSTFLIPGYANVMVERKGNQMKEVPMSAYGFSGNFIVDIKSNDGQTIWYSSFSGIWGSSNFLSIYRKRGAENLNLSALLGLNPYWCTPSFELEKSGKIWWIDLDGVHAYSERKGVQNFIRFEYPEIESVPNSITIDSANNKWFNFPNSTYVLLLKDVNTKILSANNQIVSCPESNILLTQNTKTIGEGIQKYQWKLGDGRVLFGDSVKFSFPNPGNYQVVLTALDSNGSKGFDTIQLIVNPAPELKIVPGKDTLDVCRLPVKMRVDNSSVWQELAWKNKDGIVLGRQANQDLNQYGWSYLEAKLISNGSVCIFKDSVFVSEKKLDGLVMNVELENGMVLKSPGIYQPQVIAPVKTLVVLDDQAVKEKNIVYRLSIEGTEIPKKFDKVFDYEVKSEGKFEYRAFGYSADSCLLEARLSLQFKPILLVIPNLVTQNEDQKNDQFHIDGLEALRGVGEKLSIEIFNRWGLSVYKSDDYQNNWPMDQNLNPGQYFYQINTSTLQSFKGWISIVK